MRQIKPIEAVQFIRKLRGGSQPILVRASDGCLYVIKFLNNPQGFNLLFNEAMGTELYHAAGLPVPEWRVVHLSGAFVTKNPGCWMETEKGYRKPKAGMCFGSRFLDREHLRVFEILSGEHFSRIRNRRSFWLAWALDSLGEHADNRQALFLEGATKWIEACFIDHGHLLGGAHGTASPFCVASRYIDARVYDTVLAGEAEEIQKIILNIDLIAYTKVAKSLPLSWRTVSAMVRFERLVGRIADKMLLKETTDVLLGSKAVAVTVDLHSRASSKIGPKRSNLRELGLPTVSTLVVPEDTKLVSAERRRGPQAVRMSWLEAAG